MDTRGEGYWVVYCFSRTLRKLELMENGGIWLLAPLEVFVAGYLPFKEGNVQ